MSYRQFMVREIIVLHAARESTSRNALYIGGVGVVARQSKPILQINKVEEGAMYHITSKARGRFFGERMFRAAGYFEPQTHFQINMDSVHLTSPLIRGFRAVKLNIASSSRICSVAGNTQTGLV